jgi:hypothetical protein
MKSPAELRLVLRRHWEDATRREMRLLGAKDAWPLVVSIGRPSPKVLGADIAAVKRHVFAWRQVGVGEVVWKAVRYRATAEAVEMPVEWRLSKPSEWLDACADATMRQEFESLAKIAEQTDSQFHPLIVRRRSLWRGRPTAEVVQAARLAMALSPRCAAGRPLRMLSIEGIDTKFFERNAQLVTALLDVRFDGEVSKIGLESFLAAFAESDHWVLLLDLDGALLPFKQMRVRSADLRTTALPGDRLLIVENESCQHQLASLPGTIAVLGAGFDLGWADAHWLSKKMVAYWGDIDTWGLQCLAMVRRSIPHLVPLLMSSEIFARFCDLAVPEPVVAGTELPVDLTASEKDLYRQLLGEPHGRLEQEFLPQELCWTTIQKWARDS